MIRNFKYPISLLLDLQLLFKLLWYSTRLQNMAFFEEISSVHEPKIRCASVRLFSAMHLRCLLGVWLIKYSKFRYFLLFLTLKGPVLNSMHISRAILTSLLLLS